MLPWWGVRSVWAGAGDRAAKGSRGPPPPPRPGGQARWFDVVQKLWAVTRQGGILNREQLCKHDSGRWRRGSKVRGAGAQEEAAPRSPERLRGEEQPKPASREI